MDRNGARPALGRAISGLLRLPVIAGLAAGSAMAAPTAWGQDSTAPQIASIERHLPDSSPALNGGRVTWRVTFDEDVQNVTAEDFGIAGTTGTLSLTTVSASVYDVAVSGGNMVGLNDTITLSVAGGHNIEDLANNALADTTPTGVNEDTFVLVGDAEAAGGEFLVNTTTHGSQSLPRISALAGGGFVVTWRDLGENDGDASEYAIRAQIFAADGSHDGSDFLVNTTTTSSQHYSSVAGLANGGFVIVWADSSQTGVDTSFDAVRGQMYDAQGDAVGLEFLVNTNANSDQTVPWVAGLANGDFVVVWEDKSGLINGENSSSEIRAQRYDGTGTAIGGEFSINTTILSDQIRPHIASLLGGGFVVAYEDDSMLEGDTSLRSIRAQRFDFAGNMGGAEFLVNETMGGAQEYLSISALQHGGFAIVWQDSSGVSGTNGIDIRGQLFGHDGSRIGSEFLANATTVGDQIRPSVSALGGGGFVVTWADDSQLFGDLSESAIVGRRFDAQGEPLGSEFRINTTTHDYQSTPEVVGLNDGSFVVTWGDLSQTGGDISNNAIRAQLFGIDSTAPLIASIERLTPASSPTNADSVTWRILFTETVVNVDTSDFSVSGTTGTVTNVANSSGNFWDVTVSGGDMASLDGTITLSFAGGQDIEDAAGNALTNTTPYGIFQNTFVIDNTAPRVTQIQRRTNELTGFAPRWTVRFDEDVSNLGVGDFTVSGTTGTLSQIVLTSTELDMQVSGGDIANLNGTVTLSFAGGQDITDLAGNALTNLVPTGLNEPSTTLDTIAPTVVVNIVEDLLAPGETSLVTFEFSEPVIALSLSPAATGGTLSDFTQVDTDSWTANFTAALAEGVGTVSVQGAEFEDEAGNQGSDASDTVGLSNPRIASIERQSPATSPTTSDTLTWRVTFNRDVSYTPAGAVLTNTDNVTDDATLALDSASWVAAAEVNGTDYVFVTGYGDSGVSVFSVASDGTLTHVETVLDDGTLLLDTAFSAVAAVVGGTPLLFVAGYGDNGISVFSIANDGTLTNVDNVADDGTLLLDAAYAVHTADVGGTTYLFVASLIDSGVSVFSVANDGTLTNVDNVADDATLELHFPRSLDTAVIEGTTYLFVAGTTDDGISVFSVANDGTLTNVENVADGPGLALDGVHGVTAITIDGRTYLYVAAYRDDRVQVFEVNAAGQLNLFQTVIDDDLLELERVIAFTPAVINNQTYLIAAGTVDNGISLFSVANNGTLTSVQNIADDATLLLYGARSGATAMVGAQTLFIVAGYSDNGVSVFSIAPDGAASGNFVLAGTTATATETRVSSSVIDVTASGGDLAGLDGTVTLSLSGTQDFADLAGNALTDTTPTGTNNNTFDVDNTAPTLTAFARNTPSGSTTNADTLVWDITFNEAVQNVSADDFTILGTTATGVLAGSGAAYTLTVSGGDLAGLSGSLVRLNLAGGQDITDLAGHALPAGEPATDESWQVDNTAPVLSEIRRNTPADEVTGADTLVFALTFNSLMNGVAADDFTVSGTTATASITSGADGDALYQLTLTGGDLAALNNVTVGIALSGSADATDTAGNTVSQQAPDTVQTYTMSNPVPSAFSKVFSADSIVAGGTSTLTFTIDNTANLVAATALDFTDNLPAGVVVAATPNAATTCTGGTVTATAGSGSIAYTSGTVSALSNCTVSVDVTSSTVGSHVNTSGDLTSSLGNSGPASDTLTVTDVTAPRLVSIERTTPASSPTGDDTLTWTLTFDEPVELEVEDLTLTGSTATLSVSPSIPPDLPETSGAPVAPPPAVTAAVWTVTASGGDLADLAGTVTLGFAGPVLTNSDNFDDDDEAGLVLDGARVTAMQRINGVDYLFVAGGGFTDPEQGISVFSLNASGQASFLSAVRNSDDAALRLQGVYGLAVAAINGDYFLYAAGRFDSGISVFEIDQTDGSLTNIQNIANSDDLSTFLSVPDDLVYADLGGGLRLLVVAGESSRGISSWTVGDDGLLTSAFNLADDASALINRPNSVTGAVAGGLPYLVTGSEFEMGLSTFAIGAGGSLTFADSLADSEDPDLHLGLVDALDVEVISGTVYIYAASSSVSAIGEDGGISVFTIAPGGALTNVFNVSDASVGYSNVVDIDAFYLDGSYYVAVSMFGSGRVAIYHANSDGSLSLAYVLRQSDDVNYRIAGASGLAIFDIGSDPYLAIAGSTSDGFSLFGLANGPAPVDASGNPVTNFNPTGTNEPSYELDNTAPLLTSIERQTPSGQNIGASVTEVTFRATFSEDLSAAPAIGDFSVTGDVTGTVTAVTAVTGSSVFDVTVDTLSGDGALGLSMSGSISDDAGNVTGTPVPSTTETYERDIVAPRVASIENYDPTDNPTNADTVVWRVTFDEAVSNLNVDDFEVSGTTGSLSYVRQFSNRIEMRLSGGDVADGDIIASLAFAAGQNITDQHGNPLTNLSVTGTNDNTWWIDNAPPAIDVIYTDDTATASATLVTWDISFFENQTGLTIDDFTLTPSLGVTASDLQISVDNGTSVQVTANLTGNGTAQLSFNANSPIVDDLGNGNGNNGYAPAYTDDTFSVATVDTAPPLVASIERQTPASSPTNASSVTWRILFSETVQNVDVSDFTVSGTTGGVTNVTNPSGNFWDVTVTGGDMGGLDGTITLNFAGGQNITDAAGNALTDTTPYGIFQNTFVLDISAPFLTAFVRNTPAGEKTNADTLVYDISFSEAVTNVSADDFDITGTTATGVLDGSGSAYTLTLSGGDLATYNGIAGIDLAGGQDITDLAGNALPDAEPAMDETYDVRNLAPALASITRSSPGRSPTNADSLVWDLSFSAIDSTFTLPANAFTVTGTTATVTDVSRYSIGLYVTVSGGDLASLDGDVTLGLADTDFADDYGNVMDRTIPGGAELSFTVDNTAPSITSTARQTPSDETTNSDSLIFAITFSESVANVSADDFNTTGTTATGVLAGSGADYTLTLSGGDLAGLSGVVGLNLSGSNDITDAVGNAVSTDDPATNETYTLDNAAPLVASIVRQSPTDNPTNAGSVTWRVTFNETVSGLSSDDFTVSGTTATLTAGNLTATSVDVTASGGDMGSLDATIVLSFSGTQDIADSVGNALTNTAVQGIDESSWTIDRVFPTVTITGPAGPVSGAFTATFTFSEDVTGFELGDISVANGAASNLSGSGAVYTATITPEADGLVTIDVAVDVASDAVDNGNLAATQFSVTNDETAPTVTIAGPSGPVSGTFTATFTFSEDVTGFDLTDIFLANGSASDLTGSGSTYTATITPSDDGNVTVNVVAGRASDAAGNGNAAASQFSVTNDETAPTLVITGPAGPVSGAFTATFTFSEDVTGFDAGDITVANGAASDFSGSGAVYTATITPAADGSVTIDVSGDAASDAAGNGSSAATQFSVTNDETAPTLAITGPAGPVSGAFTATFTFSEDVTGFDAGGISVANGSASDFSGSGAVYTATITPSSDGYVTVDVASGAAADAAGNDNTAATQFSATNDETAPSLAITGPAGPVSGAFTATFTFSEDVDGFELGDVVVGNGSASGFASLHASQYTATITPAADGSVTIDVSGDAASDAAGNGSSAATQFSVTNDETAPTLAITGPAGPVSGAFTATFTFSEDVTGFDAGDIGVGNGAASDLSGSGAVYTASITPASDGSVTVDVAGGAAADAAGNDSTAASQFSLTNDETAPTLAITGPSGLVSGAFTATFTFSEDVTGFDLSDILLANGTASDLSGSASAYTATITPSADGIVTVNVVAGRALDAAGNDNTAATPFVVTNDETVPTVTVTGPAGPVTAAFTANFDFSEPVTGFALGDITVGNGSASNLAGSDASYTATITPSAAGQVSVNVVSGAAIDAAGNDNLATTAFSIVFDPEDRRLSVTFSGLGSGRLTSSPPGLDCTTDCFADFDIDTSVRVTATALPGSVFRRWTSGPCAGTHNGACIIPMTDDIEIGALFSLEDPVQGRVVTAVLPGARSSYVGGPVMTAYLTAVSAGGTPAQSCYISTPSNAPVTMTSQRLDAGGAPTGPLNPVFDLEAGGSASFVLAMTPTSETAGYNLYPLVNCTNIAFDPVPGVNSILLTIDDVPVPDILSIGATPSGDGVIRIPVSGRAQVMTAAAVNIGAGDGSAGAGEVTLTATVDTGEAVLPVSLEMCQIDAAAQCITPRGPSVTANMPGNTPLFFAAFVRDTSSGAGIAFDPANARVFMRFADAGGTIRSVTSAAVTAPAAADLPVTSMVPEGRWSVLMRREDGGWPGLVPTSVHVAANGVAIVDDGVQPRLAVIDPAFDADAPGRFRQAGTDGHWTSDGMIRLGAAWANTPGEFWGVRDARSDNGAQWRDLAGTYGGSVHILDTGEIRGVAGSCAVYGQASGPASSVVILSLTGCVMSGSHAAVIDLPANDNDAPVLVIAGQSAGWRLAQ